MSLWKNYGGVRYFLGKCSFDITRFEQILGNRTRMLELGLTTPGKHFDTYPEEDWEPDLLIYQQYKKALARYERKEIEFEEEVETCPAEPSSPTPPSYSSTAKRSTKGKERKKRSVPVLGQPESSHHAAQVEQAVQIKREPGSVVTVQSSGADAVDKAVAPPDMADFEMEIGTEQDYFRALQALVVDKDVSALLREGPVDLPALLAQLDEDEEGVLIDEIALAMIDSEILSGDGLTDMIQELAREFPTVGDLKREVERELATEQEIVPPGFGDDFEEKERQFLTDFLSLYRDFESMDEDTYHKKVRGLFREFNTIHIPDDDVTPTESQQSASPTTPSPGTPDLETTPEHATCTAHTTLQDTSPTTGIGPDIEEGEATSESATTPSEDETKDSSGPSTSGCRRKDTEVAGTVTSDLLAAPYTPTNSASTRPIPDIPFLTTETSTEARVEDPVTEQSPSPVPEPSTPPLSEPPTTTPPLLLDDTPCRHPVTGEILDDFEWLGAISDYYDQMELEERKLANKPPVVVAAREDEDLTNQPVTENSLSEPPNEEATEAPASSTTVVTEPASPTTESSTEPGPRRNPPRAAKEGISYESQLENVAPLPEYYCWRCDKGVVGDCELHGGLVPCTENITARGKKDPTKFPVPSFVRIARSTIPQGGYGTFATKFIPPGHIIGEYKGKKLTKKQYLKLESENKESGFAWRSRDQKGRDVFVDGAGYLSSNWLRFVNCARGRKEETILVREHVGTVQYYTCKPVPIGSELLVFYGADYFKDMGYDTSPDPQPGTQFHCVTCYRLLQTEEDLTQHTCAKKQFKNPDKEKTHHCHICGNSFIWRNSLATHIRRVHEKQKRFSCAYCHFKTDLNTDLRRHVATHTGEGHYKCDKCDYTSVQQKSLTVHIHTNHTNKVYRCRYKQCSVECSTQEEVYQHVRADHPVKRYQCDVCLLSFNNSGILARHGRTHGEKDDKYECEYCKRRFTMQGSLVEHMRTHTGERPYKCEECGKGFAKKCNLTRHMRTHSGEVPYSCIKCGRTFNQSSNLRRHVLICPNSVRP